MRAGIAAWVGGPDHQDLLNGTPLLRITTNRTTALYWVYHGRQETRLHKWDGTVYHLNLSKGWCSCPDHEKKGVTCKHVKALRAALKKF
jgi:predicted nucleic acid-binding Zn finger protein